MGPLNRSRWALAVLLAGALAGCAAPATPSPPEALAAPLPDPEPASGTPSVPPEPAPPRRATGRLVVSVMDTAGAQLEGAEVRLGPLTALTGPRGTAALAEAPAGDGIVTVSAAGHRDARAGVHVQGGTDTALHVTLLPLEHAREPSDAGEGRLRYVLEGRYDCTATYLIVTGDCLALLDSGLDRADAPARPGDATLEQASLDVPLDLGWQRLEATLTWDAGRPGQERMLLVAGPTHWPPRDHAPRYADAEGGSPVRLALGAGERHAGASTTDLPGPLGGDVVRFRALPLGAADRPAGTQYLGVGATVDHTFTLEVVVSSGRQAY